MNSIGIQLRISDLLFAVQKRWKIIVSLTFLGGVFGVLLSGMNYVQSAVQTYQINGSFVINAVNSQGRYSGNSIAPSKTDMTLATDLYDTVYYLLRSDRLLYRIINDEQMLGVSASDIRNGLSISQYNDTNIITMRLTWDNGEEGMNLWQALIDKANSLLPEIVQVGRLQIFNEPESTLIRSSSANIKTWMVLPVLGFGAGMGFAIIELMMRPTLINVKDVETVFGLETIGIIPYDPAYFSNKISLLVSDEKSSSEVTQNYSSSAYILRNRIGLKEKCHCFYITSTTGHEGRTSAAANLAIQLSDMERHTLLIDYDYKNPMLGSLFLNNLDYSHSLNALYRGEITMADAITTLTGYLDILPMVMEHNLIYLDSTIIDMISQLREQYQYIIIDAPPVGKESETLSLNQVANTVLFVVRYDTASIPEIQATLEKLDKSGIRILGCIVNGLKSSKNVLLGGSGGSGGKNAKKPAAKKKKKALPGTKKEETQDSEDARKDLVAGKKKKSLARTGKSAQSSTPEQPRKTDLFADLAETPAEPPAEKTPEAPPAVSDFVPVEAPETRTVDSGFVSVETPETPPSVDSGFVPVEAPETPPAASVLSPVEDTARTSDAYPDFSGFDTTVGVDQPKQADLEAPQPEISQEPEQQELVPLEPVLSPAPEQEPDQPLQTVGVILSEPLPPADEPFPLPLEPTPELVKEPKKKQGLFSRKPKTPAAPKKPAANAKKKAPPADEESLVIEAGSPKKKSKVKEETEKKSGFLPWGKKKQKEKDPFESIKSEPAVITKRRNVFDDLMDEGPLEPTAKSDDEMMEELLRMGLDGSWDQAADKGKSVNQPRSGKKSPFDDL
ncbi:MAG: AAA family ATPase [Clostridia bacterium]|nr:AAA family ATPase [Clostridia bacterium]